MKIDRTKKWWGILGSDEPVPTPETKAQENFRRTFLKQVAGSVLVAGGATKAGRNILEPMVVAFPPPPGGTNSMLVTMTAYPGTGGFGSYLSHHTLGLTSFNDYGMLGTNIQRGVRRG